MEKTRAFLESGWLSLVLRVLVAAMIILAAIPKFHDVVKYSVTTLHNYYIFTPGMYQFLGHLAPWLELLVGLGLLFGVLTRLSAFGWGALSIVYFSVKFVIIYTQHRIVPCGCFPGILAKMVVTQSIWIDVVTIPMCVIIMFSKNRNFFGVGGLIPESWQRKLKLIW
jgi:hypothetical protein